VSIVIYEYLYSSGSAFVWIHLEFGVEGKPPLSQEMDSQEDEYGNNTEILWPHLLFVYN
jgi:hypothetical protein